MYRTSLVCEDLTAQDSYDPADGVGTWRVTFHEGGRLKYAYKSETSARTDEVESVFVVHDDRIFVDTEVGAYRCQDMYGVTAGVYSWSWLDGRS